MQQQQRARDLLGPAVEQLVKIGVLLQCKLQSGKSPLRRDGELEKARVSTKCWRVLFMFTMVVERFICLIYFLKNIAALSNYYLLPEKETKFSFVCLLVATTKGMYEQERRLHTKTPLS